MHRKKRYLITNEEIPRRSRYRRKKIQEAARPNNGFASQDEVEPATKPTSSRSMESHRNENSFSGQWMDCDSSNQISSDDISDMEDLITFQQPIASHQNDSPSEFCGTSGTSLSGHQSSDGSFCDSDTDINNAEQESVNDESNCNIEVSPSSHTSNNFIDPLVNNEDINNVSDTTFNKTNVLLGNTLCKCSPTTEGDILLMCLALGIRHSLSWVAMVDILKMINTIYNYEAIHASKYFLHKYFDVGKDGTKFHIYCPKCEAYIGVRDEIDNDNLVYDCGEKISNFDKITSYFLSVDLRMQFKQLLELPEVAHKILTHRFERSKINPDAYEDIYDGASYKKFCMPGCVLSDPLNFSYTFSTDGVSLGKSTSTSVWPIYAYINELPPKERRKHMLFAGVWVGKKDPNMRLFLKPFVEEANRLSTEGVEWKDQSGKLQVSKIIPLCCVCDSGARYKLLNMSSFHAYYGCTFCYHVSENTVKGRRFTTTSKDVPLRTHESMLCDMEDAFNNRDNKDKKKRIVRGQKGPTPLVQMLHISLDEAFVVDFMHSVLLGNVRSHVFVFLESVGKVDYYIGAPETRHRIDQRLVTIRPPKSITRNPRSLTQVKLWKASEWRSFILYYCIICLSGVIHKKYLIHLAFLSSAMYILLKRSITVEEIQMAENYLLKYVYYTENYFGKTAMLYNVHLLQHITKGVYNWGPLWTHNAFDFEGNNHKLVQMYTSPGFVAQQLSKRYLIFNSFPTLCEKYASTDHPLDFIQEITGKHLKSYFRSGELVLLGSGKTIFFEDDSTEAHILCSKYTQISKITSYSKFISKGLRFTTSEYSKGKLNNDSYVAINEGKRARIDYILRIESAENSNVMLLVTELVLDKTPVLKTTDITVTHIKKIIHTGVLFAVEPREITGQCVYMNVDTGSYVADISFGSYND